MTTAQMTRHQRRSIWPPIVILVGALVTAAVVLSGAPGIVRIPAATMLFLTGAGLAWTPVLNLHRDRLLAAVCVLGLSISCVIITAQLVMWLASLQWQACVWIIAIVTVVGAVIQLAVKGRAW